MECCESPQLDFKIRHGDQLLANDTLAKITLPKGVISQEGLQNIARYLRGHYAGYGGDKFYDLSYLVFDENALDPQWQVKTGNYTKRLSKIAYDRYALKLSPVVMSQVGNIARDHSSEVNFVVDVTRKLNLSAWDFNNVESCWWGSYSESRCILKTNGGFGFRAFNEASMPGQRPQVEGRAWVMPLRDVKGELQQTFRTITADAFVMFNGYGSLSSYAGPRALAAMLGWTYKRVPFECGPMYINSDGFLIAAEDITTRTSSLELNAEQHSDLFPHEQLEEEKERERERERELNVALTHSQG